MTKGILKGKTAIIGGSTQGIGLAIAQALSYDGVSCVLISRKEQKLQAATKTLSTEQGQVHQYIVADFQHPDSVRAAVSQYLTESRSIDIIVNNTGGPPAGPLLDASTDTLLLAFQQHVICNHIISTLCVPEMKSKGFGRIINIISTSVKVPLRNLGVSNTIRAAVASWAKTLANELAQYGITVNNILPGATATSRLDEILANKMQKTGSSKKEAQDEMLVEIPAKRFGKPEEIAALAAFLASPSAAYINGCSIPVDGGRTGAI